MRNLLRSRTGIILLLLLAVNFMDNGLSDPKDYFIGMLISLPGIVIGLSFHEFGHAFVSYKLGDPTPKYQGRVTIDPRAHFDPFGFLALMFCGFGWGVPVQIDPRYYKHPRRDEFLVSIAGVTMNLVVAFAFALISKVVIKFGGFAAVTDGTMINIVLQIVIQVVIINVILMVFNLIPIPPLDGFGILTQIFNLRRQSWYETVYNNGFMILMILLLFNVIDKILNPAVYFIYNLIFYNIIM